MSDDLVDIFLDSVQASVYRKMEMNNTSQWLERNTAHPMDDNKPWSFHEHEYQIEIANDPANRACWRKCAQVGASELSTRVALAVSSVTSNTRIIYTLPTHAFAKKYSSDRVDSVIQASDTLSLQTDDKVNNTSVKKFGNSFLYISGANSQNQAISIPAKYLFFDEVDFSNPMVLTSFESRIKHNKEGEYWIRKFSTPTLPNFGIDLEFTESSQAYYAVKHDACGSWVVIKIPEDIVVPKWDNELFDLEAYHVKSGMVDISKAWVKCPHCHKEIKYSNLSEPTNREWVHTYPDIAYHGYQIFPWDVPKINSLEKTLNGIKHYKRKQDWVNFDLGLPYQSTDDNILMPDRSEVEFYESRIRNSKYYIGIDVGKICHLVVIYENGYSVKVPYYATFENSIDESGNHIGLQFIKEIVDKYKPHGIVIDSLPDITLANMVHSRYPNIARVCEYKERPVGKSLTSDYKDEKIVKAYRTGTFDELSKITGKGRLKLSAGQDFETFKAHARSMFVQRELDENGQLADNKRRWSSTGDDHYAHALNYAFIASKVYERDYMAVVNSNPMGIIGGSYGKPQRRNNRRIIR